MTIINETELDRIIAEHDKMSGGFKQAMGGDNCWDAGIEITKSCGNLFDAKYSIVFSVLADEKIKRLMKVFPNLEWLGYLVGEVNRERSNVYVEDIIIPKQMVSSGAVTNVEYEWNEGLPIIGVIHSHHGMGAFFSGTDDAYINQNHDVSIVVATRTGAEIKAQVRIKAPCGKFYICDNVKFAVNAPFVLDVGSFMEVIIANIKAPIMNVRNYVPNYYQRTVGGGNVRNINERVQFKPFTVEDFGIDDDINDMLDEIDEIEDEYDVIISRDDVDSLMTDHKERESWTDLVEKQKVLMGDKEEPKVIPVVVTDNNWLGIGHNRQRLPLFTINTKAEELIRSEKFGWLVK